MNQGNQHQNQATRAAQYFIHHEIPFHLGFLTTEQSHSKTLNFSDLIRRSTADGLINLMEVDRDIVPVAKQAFHSEPYQMLVKEVTQCIRQGQRVIFSSCGASGRLVILLEAMWREFWNQAAIRFPKHSSLCRRIENQVASIMTGGERALIRAVENFEDYQSFGRRQAEETGIQNQDIMIALTEGGEISSVIGSMKHALAQHARVFMIHNNPAEILRSHFERSKEVIDHPEVITIDLTTGPMAIAGSTRMQATTIGMLIVGAALEEAFSGILPEKHQTKDLGSENLWADQFAELLDQLQQPQVINGLSRWAELEAALYRKGGLVTYSADCYLLDILSDTTERTPTFMIPPFRNDEDLNGPDSWAFVKHPHYSTPETWEYILKRPPRGLSWSAADYQKMGADRSIIKSAPKLSREDILKYRIGNEPDPSRYVSTESVLITIRMNNESVKSTQTAGLPDANRYKKQVWITIGDSPDKVLNPKFIPLPVSLSETSINLFHHLALKMILNTVSTATMALLGRISGNWMIQVDATNKKLIDRATRIVAHFSGLSYEAACEALFQTMYEPKIDRLEFKKSYVIQTLERLGVSY